MIYKTYVFDCDWCGETHTSCKSIKEYAHYYLIYKFKSVSPLADDLWLKNKNAAFKYLTFCCKECADEYFKENPEDKKFYKLIEYKNKK